MTAVDKLLFITLLCLADEEGKIKDCDEDTLKQLTHLYEDPYETNNDWNRATGFLQRFSDNGMITLDTNGCVIINNWMKRQSKNLSGYERVKRWRDKQKQANKPFINDNNDNARIEENRIDILGANAPGYTLSKESEEEERPKKDKGADKEYEVVCLWAEKRRGFKFVNRVKQYAALKKAKGLDISITKLKNRWTECEGEVWRDGFDWTSVVSTFDKKA